MRLTDVAEVARRLRDLDIEGVFVGGATVAALVTDPASVPPRYTEDVDVVVPADSRLKYEQVEERLRAAGYAQPMGEHPICRWMIGGILVDLTPLLPEILGFGNRWYISALSSARVFRVDHTQFRLNRCASPVGDEARSALLTGCGRSDDEPGSDGHTCDNRWKTRTVAGTRRGSRRTQVVHRQRSSEVAGPRLGGVDSGTLACGLRQPGPRAGDTSASAGDRSARRLRVYRFALNRPAKLARTFLLEPKSLGQGAGVPGN